MASGYRTFRLETSFFNYFVRLTDQLMAVIVAIVMATPRYFVPACSFGKEGGTLRGGRATRRVEDKWVDFVQTIWSRRSANLFAGPRA